MIATDEMETAEAVAMTTQVEELTFGRRRLDAAAQRRMGHAGYTPAVEATNTCDNSGRRRSLNRRSREGDDARRTADIDPESRRGGLPQTRDGRAWTWAHEREGGQRCWQRGRAH